MISRSLKQNSLAFVLIGLIISAIVIFTPQIYTISQPKPSHISSSYPEYTIHNKDKCIIAYVRESDSYEYLWTYQVLLSQIYTICGCSLQFVSISEYWNLIQQENFPYNFSIIQLNEYSFKWNLDWNNLEDFKKNILTKSVCIHFGDEQYIDKITAYYSKLKYVFRNYCGIKGFNCSLHYLQEHSIDFNDNERIKWIPLGYSTNMMTSDSLRQLPLSKRSNLFFFAGSIRNQYREVMVKTIKDNYTILRMYLVFL